MPLKVSMSRWARWSARAAYALALGAVISLAGPGPRLLDAAPSAIVPAGNAVVTHQVLLSGTAVQGPMVASTVTAYAVNPATGADLQVLGTAKTDASGNFTVKILSRVSPLRLAVTGGSFISEADGSTVHEPRRVTVLLPSATIGHSGHLYQSTDEVRQRSDARQAASRPHYVRCGALQARPRRSNPTTHCRLIRGDCFLTTRYQG